MRRNAAMCSATRSVKRAPGTQIGEAMLRHPINETARCVPIVSPIRLCENLFERPLGMVCPSRENVRSQGRHF